MVNYEQILSARVKEVQPSGIRRFFELAAKMPHAISLGVGEPDFETRGRFAARHSVSGKRTDLLHLQLGSCRAAQSDCRARAPQVRLCYDADKEILVTVGGSEAIDNTIRAIVNVGDEC